MNWQTTFRCVQTIAGMKRDSPQAIALLQREAAASSQLSAAEKIEIDNLLDDLQAANLYGQISLVSRLKELLSKHAEFRAMYPEIGVQKP